MLREWIWRIRNLIRGKRASADRTEEMQFHFDMEVQSGMRQGLDEKEARRRAVLRAGRVPQGLEAAGDAAGFPLLDMLRLHLRHAARALLRNPGFASIAVLVLSASVAMNTLIFFLLDGVVLRPLPYASPQQLVRVYDSSQTDPKFPVAIGRFLAYREHARSLDGLALYTGNDVELSGAGNQSELLKGVAITPDFFTVLGTAPAMGRAFTAAELTSTVPVRNVILSHRTWTNKFQADPAIVGKSIRLNREPWTVIGVAPAGFQHVGGEYRSPLHGETVDVWLPLNLPRNDGGMYNAHFCNAIARVRPGNTAAQAREDLQRVATDVNQRFPKRGQWNARVEPLLAEVTGRSRQIVWLLAIGGALVLLIACGNVAGLCIARSLARQQEFSLRQALGATRWHLLMVGLAETLLTGLISSAIGLGIAAAGVPLLRQLLPADFPRAHEVGLTLESALFAVTVTLLTALLAGILPSLGAARPLQAHARTTASRESTRLRTALVTGEVALAGLLAAASLFLLRSYQEVSATDHGFNQASALTFQITIPTRVYREKTPQLIEDVRRGILEVPGIVSAGASTNLPWSGYDENSSFGIPGRVTDDNDAPSARFQAATPGYFEAAGMRLVFGRFLDPARDIKGKPLQVIVNDALAKAHFGDRDPVGTELNVWGEKRQIAGVVRGIRDYPADLDVKPAFWFPFDQMPFGRVFFVVRVKPGEDPARSVAAVTAAVHAVDAELPVSEVKTLERHAQGAMAARRFALWLFESFAFLGLLLAAAGIYGLLAYLVQQRRKEFGIRAAMGASRADLWRMIVRDSLRIAVTGGVICALLIPAAGAALRTLLYKVTVYDAWTFAGALTVLAAVSLAASLSPAWVASTADPAAALRDE